MAVVEIKKIDRLAYIQEFLGLSGDTKPTTNVEIGSTYWALDTKLKYIFDGTTWYAMA